MAEKSLIAWTHNTFNPWIGCSKVSDGCKNCYAETLVVNRMGRPNLWGPAKTTARSRTSRANWQTVLRWHKTAEKLGVSMRVFCASLADVFENHPDLVDARRDLFELIRATPFFQWQILTKRPENIVGMLPADWGLHGWANVWLGTSIENMKVAERADILRRIPAAVRFVSYEPALGPLNDLDLTGLDWFIFGGESGPGYRPMDVQWARDFRALVDAAGSDRLIEKEGEPLPTFYFKQSAAPRTEMGTKLDGETVRNYPTPRSVLKPEHYGLKRGDRVLEAQRERIRLDRMDKPQAPFFEADPRVEKRRADALPLFGDNA